VPDIEVILPESVSIIILPGVNAAQAHVDPPVHKETCPEDTWFWRPRQDSNLRPTA